MGTGKHQVVEKVRNPDSMKKSLPSLKHPALDSFDFYLNVLESPTELVLRSDFFHSILSSWAFLTTSIITLSGSRMNLNDINDI
jgi:hypothetical protein